MNPIIRKIAANAFIAALYVVLTLASYPLSFNQIQFRVAEVLVLLCFFRKDFVIGLTCGCALANLFSTLGPIDIAFGSAATLIACLCICISKHLCVAILFPVISNEELPILLSEVETPLYVLLYLPILDDTSVGTVTVHEFPLDTVHVAVFVETVKLPEVVLLL